MKTEKSYRVYFHLLLKQQVEKLSQEEQIQLKEGMKLFPELEEAARAFKQQNGLLRAQQYAFKPFFTGRVIHKLQSLREHSNVHLMYAFKRLAVPAFGVICLWLLNIYFMDGALDLDNIVGLADWDTVDEYTLGNWIN